MVSYHAEESGSDWLVNQARPYEIACSANQDG